MIFQINESFFLLLILEDISAYNSIFYLILDASQSDFQLKDEKLLFSFNSDKIY